MSGPELQKCNVERESVVERRKEADDDKVDGCRDKVSGKAWECWRRRLLERMNKARVSDGGALPLQDHLSRAFPR